MSTADVRTRYLRAHLGSSAPVQPATVELRVAVPAGCPGGTGNLLPFGWQVKTRPSYSESQMLAPGENAVPSK